MMVITGAFVVTAVAHTVAPKLLMRWGIQAGSKTGIPSHRIRLTPARSAAVGLDDRQTDREAETDPPSSRVVNGWNNCAARFGAMPGPLSHH